MQILTQDDAVATLSDRQFAVVRYRERYEALAARLGLDLGAILAAFDAIPLCLRDEAHEVRRTAVAQLMAERRPLVQQALPEIVRSRFDRLRHPGACDATCSGRSSSPVWTISLGR